MCEVPAIRACGREGYDGYEAGDTQVIGETSVGFVGLCLLLLADRWLDAELYARNRTLEIAGMCLTKL